MINQMVKEHTLGLMEESMKDDSRMGENTVKGHSLQLRETSMYESGERINIGKEQNMTKGETSLESL